ncbi:MAG: hypothetical protein EHM63_06015 [Actinobacteria bacterium]|nr:MAG: hypothetical protein EHM63_06015 [Actinomycetota bacterium]
MIRVRGIPIYWGIETEPEDRTFWCYSILHEALPPFRHSTYGIRMRVSHRHWLHVGKFLYDKNARYYGLPVTPSEISSWGRNREEETFGADPDAVEVRQIQPLGPDRHAGGVDDAERGAVPGAEPQRARSDVGAEPDGDAGPDGAGSDTGIAAEGGTANVLR